MEFSEILKNLLEENDMKKTDLAIYLGRRASAITSWLKGESYPSFESVLKLCEIFNITPNQIFGFEEIDDAYKLEKQVDNIQTKIDYIVNDFCNICETLEYTQKKLERMKKV